MCIWRFRVYTPAQVRNRIEHMPVAGTKCEMAFAFRRRTTHTNAHIQKRTPRTLTHMQTHTSTRAQSINSSSQTHTKELGRRGLPGKNRLQFLLKRTAPQVRTGIQNALVLDGRLRTIIVVARQLIIAPIMAVIEFRWLVRIMPIVHAKVSLILLLAQRERMCIVAQHGDSLNSSTHNNN